MLNKRWRKRIIDKQMSVPSKQRSWSIDLMSVYFPHSKYAERRCTFEKHMTNNKK